MFVFADPLIFILFIIAFILAAYLADKISPGAMNVIFISFAASIFLLGLSRLFLVLSDGGYFHLDDTTATIWWHIIFYCSMLAFIWGGSRLKQIATSSAPVGFNKNDAVVFIILFVISIGVFFIAAPLEPKLLPLVKGSFIEQFGIYHFIAFVLAAVVAYYLYYIKANWGQLLAVGMGFMIVFLSFMSLQHLWELLVETFKVIPIASGVGEHVEQFIIIPGLIFLIIALFRVRKVVQSVTGK